MLRKFGAVLRRRRHLPEPSQFAAHAFDYSASRINLETEPLPPSDTRSGFCASCHGKSNTRKLAGANVAETDPTYYVTHDDYEFLKPPTGSFGSVPAARAPKGFGPLELHIESCIDLDCPTSFSLHSLEIPITVEEMEAAEVPIAKVANGQLALEENNVP